MKDLVRPEVICRERIFLCRDRVGQGKEELCRDRAILCRDRVGQGRENFGHDKESLGHDRAGHDKEEAMRTRQNRPSVHNRGILSR